MADQPDAVEAARRKALAEDQDRERGGRETDPATKNPVHERVSGDFQDEKLAQHRRENPDNIKPGLPGSPGQPTDPPVDLIGDPANSPIAADDTAAIREAQKMADDLNEDEGGVKFAIDREGHRGEEVSEVVDRTMAPEDLAETNEARAELRAEAEKNAKEFEQRREEQAEEARRESEEKQDERNEARKEANKRTKK